MIRWLLGAATLTLVAGCPMPAEECIQKGDVYACHRLVGNEQFKIGTVKEGIDRDKRFNLIGSIPQMRQMGDIIVRGSDLTAEAVPLLRSLKTHARRLHEITDEITRLEEESDRLYDEGMSALFHGPARKDPMAFIVGGEVYDHLEKVVDRLEDVANRISGVLVEHL